MGKPSEFILIKTNLGKVTLSTELLNLALYELYFLNISCTLICNTEDKLSSCFKDRSGHSFWNHVIICLFYSIHVSLRNHDRCEGRIYTADAEGEGG